MKNYSVSVTAFANVVVIGAESEEQAMEIALQDIDLGDLQHDTTEIRWEIDEGEIESCKSNADLICEP